MNFLKGLVLSLLSFLLFLSLSIFGIAFTVKSTLLNPDFVVAEVNKLEVSSLARELIDKQLSEQLPQEAGFPQEIIKEAIYSVISDQEPWLKEQVSAAIYAGYDFLLGKSERLELTISLEVLKESLRDSLWRTLTESLPLGLLGLPSDQIEPYFNQLYEEFAGQIPSEFEVDESYLPPEVMAQIIQVREGISYFMLGYNILIGFMVLLVLGVIFINRNIKSITRGLGITLLTYGALEYAGVFAARYFAPVSLLMSETLAEIPSSLQMWLTGLFSDLLAPLEMFSLCCLVGGVVLIIASFVYRPRVAEE
ncbi:hypothetical protein ACFLUZ_03800 [Chloroflexota bacterium]